MKTQTTTKNTIMKNMKMIMMMNMKKNIVMRRVRNT